jgi:putative transposase
MIQKIHPLSKLRRCELLNISQSLIYYQPKSVSDTDQTLMKLIDETHTTKSFLGSRRIVDSLADDHSQVVNRKRVSRLMKVMGIQAIYPKLRTTQSNPQHKVYPYLLRNKNIDQSHQVWATDITYIPMVKGFIYLTALK